MSIDEDTMQVLAAMPLDEPVEIDGESVYLRVVPDGAELGLLLIPAYTQSQLQDVLKKAFQSAMQFDAGLGQTADGRTLVLTQWLPGVNGWTDAAQPLENLLNQASMWRSLLAPVKSSVATHVESRNEQRLRELFMGAGR